MAWCSITIQFLKYSGLLLLIVIIGYLFFGPKKNIKSKLVNSEEPKLNKGSSVPVAETKSASFDSKIAKCMSLNSKNQKSYVKENLTFAETVAKRDGKFIGICDALDIEQHECKPKQG